MTGSGTDREISAAFICQESQIHRRKFPGKFLVVQFRQTDDIIDLSSYEKGKEVLTKNYNVEF
jgi:hypothetical protein